MEIEVLEKEQLYSMRGGDWINIDGEWIWIEPNRYDPGSDI